MKKKEDFEFGNTIVNNFFRYLKKNGTSQKKYANDNNMDPTTLSKWKRGESQPTIDQLRQAAKYFSITVNDLVYNDKEKRSIEVLTEGSYVPIKALQEINVKLFGQIFKKPYAILLFNVFIFSLISFAVFILKDYSYLYASIIILGIPITLKVIQVSSVDKIKYIINYLDDIFYKREEILNRHYKESLLIRIISFFISFYYLARLSELELANGFESGLLISFTLLTMFYFFVSIIVLTDLPRKFKQEVYDHEFTSYHSTKLFLIINFAMLSVSIMLSTVRFSNYLSLLITCVVVLVINTIDFFLISKEYSKYILMYQEEDNSPRELFPKNN